MEIFKTIFALLLCLIVIISCENQTKFDKAHWSLKEDLNTYTYRDKMIIDLLDNHKIIGLKYSELVELLGEARIETTSEFRTVSYNILTEYGNDIDPIYSKDLIIALDKDSIAESFKLVENKH